MYVVIHETDFGRGPEYGAASGILPTREAAENQLAYCEGMQAEGRPGSEGAYYVAQVLRLLEER